LTAAFPYTRLGPRTPLVLGHDSLWLSADHLLSVRNRRFYEQYQRFELREIQAVVMAKTARFVVPVYWLAACVALLIFEIMRSSGVIADIAWAVLALLAIYWVAASLLQSCTCHLQTAVGGYELPGLYRVRAAQRVLQTLEARISEVQGVLPEDWTEASIVDVPTPIVAGAPAAEDPTRASIIVAVLACLALLIDALCSWYVRSPNLSRWVHTLGAFLTLVAVVIPIVSMAVSRRQRELRPLRVLFIVAVFAVGFANYGNMILTAMLAAFQAARQQPPFQAGEFFYWVNQIAEVSIGAIGLLQLLFIARGRHPSAP
jgi:hypothetical protein